MIGTAGATGHRPAVSVSPATGGPHARYTVSFRAPSAAGRIGSQQTSYAISASTKAHSGCTASIARYVTSARKGQAEHIRLAAGAGSLCKGVYQGSVMLLRRVMCGPPTMACPQYVVPGLKVGTFRFRVK